MENKDQPAFPTTWDTTHRPETQTDGGLTKREYFAGLAMQGMLANPQLDIGKETIEKAAVDFADYLLKALES